MPKQATKSSPSSHTDGAHMRSSTSADAESEATHNSEANTPTD